MHLDGMAGHYTPQQVPARIHSKSLALTPQLSYSLSC
jgi:hypothetical protein